jgi:hypothetical protein
VPKEEINSRGEDLARRYYDARRESRQAPRSGVREIPILRGLTPYGSTVVPMENVHVDATEILVQSGRVYRYGGEIVLETHDGSSARLVPLTSGGHIEAYAPALLANLFVCEWGDEEHPIQFVPPRGFVASLLSREATRDALPRIVTYASRPVFNHDFCPRGPGWHAEDGILVHGLPIEPTSPDRVDPRLPAIDRLSPFLCNLLHDFCLKSDADVANTLAVLITGLLVNHFVTSGKPVILLDGNQPGVGKTLLVRVTGIILDGEDPRVIHYTSEDEELQKRICATLRGSNQSLIVIDNAKVRAGSAVSSPVIEANSMAPHVSLRILGKSENYTRPNDVLWCLTMNDTKASPDLVSRGLPIRQYFEGDPRTRKFDGRDPLQYARDHRQEILGELAGMIVRWNQEGRPQGRQDHRLAEWARIVGGIMDANGFPEFLSNVDDAAVEFDTALDELAALAEAAVTEGEDFVASCDGQDGDGDEPSQRGWPAGDWERLFQSAGISVDRLEETKSLKSRNTILGNFLAQHVGREVPIEVKGRSGRATLSMRTARSKKKCYFFLVTWDEPTQENGEKPSGKAEVVSPNGKPPRRAKPRQPLATKATTAGPGKPAARIRPPGLRAKDIDEDR